MAQLLGWEWNIGKKKDTEKTSDKEVFPSFVDPDNNDGSIIVQDGVHVSYVHDFTGHFNNEAELIRSYRNLALDTETEWAIDEIINDAIAFEADKDVVNINLDNTKLSSNIKKKITEEFNNILELMNFNSEGDEIFRKWYIDGRHFYHKIINKEKTKDGIKELRYIDPIKIQKVKEVKSEPGENGIEEVKEIKEYFVYKDDVVQGRQKATQQIRIPIEAISYSHSGLLDDSNMVISYLHKALKPFNQLSMLEDATVIYRIARAPERRIFYVDTGNLPKTKAEQYVKTVMQNHKNKMVYDTTTGKLKDKSSSLSMMEDFWLPRKDGSKGTEVSTLPGGQNLGELDDVHYFKKRVLKSLHIPLSRSEPDAGFSLGRSQEISRDEIKFNKFITKLRKKFAVIFYDVLRTQLLLKNIITEEDWNDFKEKITFDFNKDSYFSELKESEILSERLEQLERVDPFVGKYFTIDDVQRKILRRSDEEIKEFEKQKEIEDKAGLYADEEDDNDFGGNNNFDDNDDKEDEVEPEPEEDKEDKEEDKDKDDEK